MILGPFFTSFGRICASLHHICAGIYSKWNEDTKTQIAWLRLLSKKLTKYIKDEKKKNITGASKTKDKQVGGKVLEKPEKIA